MLNITSGQGNAFEYGDGNDDQIHGALDFTGQNNTIKFAKGCRTAYATFALSGGSSITIGEDCWLGQIYIHVQKGGSVSIENGCIFNGAVVVNVQDGGRVTIGSQCLFSGDTWIFNGDGHTVFDTLTRECLNKSKDVKIGNRVWVGYRCLINKGIDIGDGAIVGAGSVLTKSVPGNSLFAGNPARMRKANVTWDYRQPSDFMQTTSPAITQVMPKKTWPFRNQAEQMAALIEHAARLFTWPQLGRS